jgi:hypothetical protein
MKLYFIIILLIYFSYTVSKRDNNQSLLVFHTYKIDINEGLFTAKFSKTINQINESDSHLFVETNYFVTDIDYSLSANLIIWREDQQINSQDFIDEIIYIIVINAIPINKR